MIDMRGGGVARQVERLQATTRRTKGDAALTTLVDLVCEYFDADHEYCKHQVSSSCPFPLNEEGMRLKKAFEDAGARLTHATGWYERRK